MVRFWIDTNILVYCIAKKATLDSLLELSASNPEILIPSGVLDELASLDKRFSSVAEHLKSGKSLKGLVNLRYAVVQSTGNVDKYLLNSARDGDYVCTHDQELAKKLRQKNKGIGIINVSSKGMLIK